MRLHVIAVLIPKTGSMDAQFEWTLPQITEVVRACEAADKEVVTQGPEPAGVADMGRVEGLEAGEDTTPKISSSIHRAVALMVNRLVIQIPDHKAGNQIESRVRKFVAFTIGWRFCHQPYTDTLCSGWHISA